MSPWPVEALFVCSKKQLPREQTNDKGSGPILQNVNPCSNISGYLDPVQNFDSILGKEALAENCLAYACQINEVFVSNPLYHKVFKGSRNFVGSARKIAAE